MPIRLGRVPFPRVRETIERIAEICQIAPHAFAEYRGLEQALSPSTRLVWQRMRERAMPREALYLAMAGRISRPYFNSILRGDQPFPTNRVYIHLFALSLDLPPTVFREYGRDPLPRWEPEEVGELERRFYIMLFDKLMADLGFGRHPIHLRLLPDLPVVVFTPAGLEHPVVGGILRRMGELSIGLEDLEKVAGVPIESFRAVLSRPDDPALAEELSAIREALRVE